MKNNIDTESGPEIQRERELFDRLVTLTGEGQLFWGTSDYGDVLIAKGQHIAGIGREDRAEGFGVSVRGDNHTQWSIRYSDGIYDTFYAPTVRRSFRQKLTSLFKSSHADNTDVRKDRYGFRIPPFSMKDVLDSFQETQRK